MMDNLQMQIKLCTISKHTEPKGTPLTTPKLVLVLHYLLQSWYWYFTNYSRPSSNTALTSKAGTGISQVTPSWQRYSTSYDIAGTGILLATLRLLLPRN